jgi:lysozyme family protein
MEMTDGFDWAIEVVLRHEGGYVDDPDDHGGATNFGISQRQYPDLDIKKLTREDAIAIYRRDWWQAYGYGQIKDMMVATKVLDLSVNMGPGTAHRLTQRALRAVGLMVSEDGVLGPVTLGALNQVMPSNLLSALRAEAAGYYRCLAVKQKSFEKFLTGWLNRAYA